MPTWSRTAMRAYMSSTRARSHPTPMEIVFADLRQTIDGFGACDYFLDITPLSDANADLFFDATAGIGLSILRSGPRSDGSIDGFYANATKAAARGARILAVPMTATAAQKSNGDENNGGHLLSASYGAYSDMLTAFASGFNGNSGVNLYAMEVQNEPDFSAGYPSMLYTTQEMVDFIKVLGPKLAGLSPRPLLIMPSTSNWAAAQSYIDAVLGDGTAAPFLDVVGVHQYAGVATLSTTKKIWQTEMSYFDAFDASITQGLITAQAIHDALTTGKASAWLWWWQIGDYDDNEGLIGHNADNTLTKRLYTLGNYSKFVRPNYVRVGTAGSLSGVSVTAFKSGASFVVVAVNQNAAAVPFAAKLSGLAVTSATPWITSASLDLVQQTAISTPGSRLAYTLPASSVTSFVGTGA